MIRRVAADSPPHSPRLLARVAGWMIVVLYAVGVCASQVLQRLAGLPNENPIENVALLVGFGAFAVVGALLVARRPANAVGWVMAAVGLMLGISKRATPTPPT